jgi:protein arginine N-methyltransferase 7
MSADPDFKRKTLHELNSEALHFHRAGDDMRCVAAFAKLFRKLRENNVVHRELYVVHSNRSAAYLNLGLYEEALWDARRCAELAELQFARTQERSALPSYIKAFARRGFALMGLRLHRLAKLAFEEGLQYDPFAEELKRGLEESTHALLGDLLSGRGRETLALPAPTKRDRIAYLPYATPMHQVHPTSLLPVSLLTPFQADNDHHVKDTYNYATVQADIRLPKRHFAVLHDTARTNAFDLAIQRAIVTLQEQDKEARVLILGAGAGLLPLLALRHGARHVTAAERWLYMALSCKETLVANGVSDDRATVVYKRPTDLALRADVPVVCNLLVCDMLEDGLLSAGLIPACRHALAKLMLPDALVLPAAATVYAQAVQLRVDSVCGFDVSATNAYRWEPAHASGTPLAPGSYVPLSEPLRVWHFDMLTPPEESDTQTVDLAFVCSGRFNAVLFWFDMHMGGGHILSTGPGSAVKTLQPALQYLPGELAVEAGMVLGLRCSHNTVRMRFDLEREEYVHLYKEDASFPRYQFSILADAARADAYQAAITRQVAKRKAQGTLRRHCACHACLVSQRRPRWSQAKCTCWTWAPAAGCLR